MDAFWKWTKLLYICVAVTIHLLATAAEDICTDDTNLCFPPNSSFSEHDCECCNVFSAGGECSAATDYGKAIVCKNGGFREFPLFTDDDFIAALSNVSCLVMLKFEFTHLDYRHTQQFSNLRVLKLEDGRLNSISNDAFNRTPFLTHLELQGNHLTSFPPVAGMTTLLDLDVSYNLIQSLQPGYLKACIGLQSLDANHNNIKELKDGVFQDNCQLQNLDLSYNTELKGLGDHLFDGPPIEKLNLSHTKISKMPYIGIRDTLKILDLTGTRNLKQYSAYMSSDDPGDPFRGRTFPLLQDVSFYYHAHCCQMRNHFYVVPSIKAEVNYSCDAFTDQIEGSLCTPSPTLSISPTPSLSPTCDVVCKSVTPCPSVATSAITFSPFPSLTPFPCDCNYCALQGEHEEFCINCRETNCLYGNADHIACEKRFAVGICECPACSRKRFAPNYTPTKEGDQIGHHLRAQPSKNTATGAQPPENWFFHPNSTNIICHLLTPTISATSPSPSPLPATTVVPAVTPTCSPYSRFDLVHGDLSDEPTACYPKPNDFNPCEDLLGDTDPAGVALRVAIWVVITVALFGNGLVIIVTVGYNFIINRAQHKISQLLIIKFLYLNLAVANFMMGVYLFTIAVVDLDTRGHFAEEAIEWQTGPGCGFAGFFAITSIMVSVFTVVLICICNLLYIVYIFSDKRQVNRTMIIIVLIFGWPFGIAMGTLPLIGVSSYSRVAICLPFDVSELSAQIYVDSMIMITGLAFIIILSSRIILVYRIHSHIHRKRCYLLLALISPVISHFVSWCPIALVALTAAHGHSLIDVSASKFFTVFVFPISACLNPIIYSILRKDFRNDCKEFRKHLLIKKSFFILISMCGKKSSPVTLQPAGSKQEKDGNKSEERQKNISFARPRALPKISELEIPPTPTSDSSAKANPLHLDEDDKGTKDVDIDEQSTVEISKAVIHHNVTVEPLYLQHQIMARSLAAASGNPESDKAMEMNVVDTDVLQGKATNIFPLLQTQQCDLPNNGEAYGNCEHVKVDVIDTIEEIPTMAPFVEQIDVLKCDSSGREFSNSDHDITLRIPEGAIPDGITVHIEAGVALHGPFQFPPGTRPISPIVWLCIQENIPFQKPIEVILPHFLHHWMDLQLGFLKADHTTHTTDNGEKEYMFQPVNDPVEFHSENGRGFGVLSTKHFCSLCIQANITRDQLPSKAQYCLTEVIPYPWPSMPVNVPIHFCVTFFLKTCFQMLEKQFPSRVKVSRSEFTFQTTELNNSEARLQIEVDEPHSGWIMALKRKEIRAAAVDYWERPQLQLMEETDMYPPRFTIEVCGTMATGNSVARLRFNGSCEDLYAEVLLPLYHQASALPVSPSSLSAISVSSSVGGGCAASGYWNERDYHHEDKRPSLPALLKFPVERGVIKVPQQIGSYYSDFGVFLLNDENGAIVDGITKEHRGNPENINNEILKKWLQGQGRQPVTWKTLIEVLRDSQLTELADEIQRNLSRLT